eukprot:scaffold19235_cov126-Isochrysis_galbana.AAC.6
MVNWAVDRAGSLDPVSASTAASCLRHFSDRALINFISWSAAASSSSSDVAGRSVGLSDAGPFRDSPRRDAAVVLDATAGGSVDCIRGRASSARLVWPTDALVVLLATAGGPRIAAIAFGGSGSGAGGAGRADADRRNSCTCVGFGRCTRGTPMSPADSSTLRFAGLALIAAAAAAMASSCSSSVDFGFGRDRASVLNCGGWGTVSLNSDADTEIAAPADEGLALA